MRSVNQRVRIQEKEFFFRFAHGAKYRTIGKESNAKRLNPGLDLNIFFPSILHTPAKKRSAPQGYASQPLQPIYSTLLLLCRITRMLQVIIVVGLNGVIKSEFVSTKAA